MTLKEKDRIDYSCRRELSKKYGFKQRDYANWKVDKGFFFMLMQNSMTEVALMVKPLYIDNLFWEIYDVEELKTEPMSFRAIGALARFGWVCNKYELKDSVYSLSERTIIWEDIFIKAANDINEFLLNHNNPDLFPCDNDANFKIKDEITRWLVLCHKGEYETVFQEVKPLTTTPYLSKYVQNDKKTNKPKGFNQYLCDYCLRMMKADTNTDNKNGLYSWIKKINPFK